MAANSLDRLTISFNVDSNYKALQLGFLEGANPGAYKRLLSIATRARWSSRCEPRLQSARPRGLQADSESPSRHAARASIHRQQWSVRGLDAAETLVVVERGIAGS